MANEDVFHLGVKALIKDQQGMVLVLHANPATIGSSPDHWDLPGGRLQKGQSIEETLLREVEEEIGVKDIKVIKLLDASISKMRLNNDMHGLVLFTFLCEVDNPKNIKLTDDEHSELKWCSPAEAADHLKVKFSDSLVELVRKL